MIMDIFGTPIQVGNVILLSKGTRGHRNLERGIVRNIVAKPGSIWVKTVVACRKYNYKTQSYNITPSLQESRHLAEEGKNGNVIVVADARYIEGLSTEIREAYDLLISSGEFDPKYLLGESQVIVEQKEEVILPEVSDIKELDIFSGLGMPSSLKKE